VVARDIGLVEAFTIEASFFGALVDRDAGAAAKDLASNSNSNSNAKEGPLEEKKNSKDSTTESSEGGGDQQGGGNGNEGANKNGDSDDDGDDDVVPAAPGHQAGSNSNKLLQSKSFKQVVPFTPHKLSLLGATLARGLLIHFHLAKEVQQYQLSKSTFRTYLGKGGNAPPKKKQNGTKSGTPSDDVTEAEAAEGKAENEKVHSPSKKSPKKRSSSSSPKKKVASIVAEQQGRSPKKKKDSSPSKKKKKSPKKKKAKKAAVDEDDVDGEENDAGDNENDELRSDAEGDEEGPTCGTKKKFTLVSDADEEPDGEEEEGQTSSASEGEVLVEAAEIKRKEADKEPDAAGEQEENDEENEKDKESEEQVEDEEADPTLEEDDRMNSPVKTSASSLSPIKPGATAAVSTMSMAASPMKTQLPGGSTSPSKGSSGSAALSGGLASFASFLANGTKSNSWVGKNVVPIHGLEFEAAPDDVRLFDFLSAESEQVWMAAQRGESVAVTKSWMNENKKLLAARAAALDIAGSSPTKQLAAAAPASSSSTTASGGESDGQKVCSSASGAEGQADTSSAVPTRLKHWENEMQSGLQAQGVRFSPDTVEESRDAGATSSLPPDLSVNGTKAVEQNKNSMSGINVEALMREILIESQEKTKKKKDPEPSDELEEGSDSNPSGDNLSPEKLRKMRERMGSRDGTNGGGKRNRIRVGGEGRGDGVRARGGGNQGHFHGLMRHYLQVRNLFNAKEDLAIRQQKMSLLNRIVAFGRTTYISKNSQNAQSMPDLALAGTGAAAGPGDTTTRGDDGTDMANALAVAEKAMQQQAGGATAGAAPAGSIAGSGACGASGPVRVSGSSSKPQPAAPLPNSDSRSSAASSATAAFASGNAAAATCEAASDSVQSVGGIPLQGSNWQSVAGASQSSSSSATTLQPVVPAPTLSNQTLSLFPSAAPSASVLGAAGAGSTNTVAPAAGAGAPSAADIAGAGVEIANSMINGTGLGSASGGAAPPGMANGGTTGTGANSGATATGFRTRSTPNLNRTGRKKTKKKKWVSPVIESALKFLQTTTTSGGPPVVGASNGAGNSTTVVVASKSSGPGSVSVADGTTTGLSRGVSATATGSAAAAPGAESATGAGGAAPAVANPNSFGNTVVGQPLLPGLALSSVVQPGAPCSSDVGADPSRNPNLVLVLEETHKSDQEQHGGSQEKLPRRRPMPMTILTPTHARSSASSSAGGSANASPVKGDADREQMMREQEDESRRLLEQVTQSIDTKIYEEITPLIPHTNYHHAVDKATASMLSNRQLQNPANNVDPPGGATSQPQVSAHPQPHPAQLHQQGTANPNATSSSTVLKLELEHAHPLKTRTSRSFLLKGGGHGGGHLHTGATGGAAASGPGAGAPQSLRDHLLAAASQSQAQAQDHHHDSGHVGNGMRQPSHSPDAATSAALHPAGEREGHLQGHAGAIMFNRTVGATASHHLHQLPPVQGTSGPPPHSGGYHHTQHGSSSYRGSHLQQSGPASTKTGLLSSSSSVPPLPSRSLAALVRSVDSGAAKAAAMHSSANIMDIAGGAGGGGPPSSSSTYNLAQHALQHQQQHTPHQLHVSTQQHPLPAANGSWTTTNTGVNSTPGVAASSGPGSHHQYAHGHGHAQLQHHHLHRGGGHQSGEHPASSTSMKMIFAGASSQHVGSSQPHHPATHSVMGAIRRALSQQNQNEQDAHFGSSGGASSSGSNVVIVDEQHHYTGGLGGHPQHHGTSSGAGGAGPGAPNGASTTNPNRSGRLFQRHTIQNGARMIVQLDNKPWYGGAGGAQSGGPAARTTTRQL